MATASLSLTKAGFALDAALSGFVKRELSPTPGRRDWATRAAITACITLLIGETCRSQNLFIGLFIPLLLPRDTPQQTWAGAKGTMIIAWSACAFAIVLTLLTADLPWLRVTALAFGVFVCVLLSRGLHQPPIAALGSVTVSLVLIRMDSVNSAEAAITTGLWLALMMSTGCLVATAVDTLYPHPSPQKRITTAIVDRLQGAAAVLKRSGGAELSREEQQRAGALGKLALAGTGSLRQLLPVLSTQPSVDRNYVLRLSAVLNGMDLLSDQAIQLFSHDTTHFSEEQRGLVDRVAHNCLALACNVERNVTTPPRDDKDLDSAPSPAGRQGPGQLIADMRAQVGDLWTLWTSDVTASKDSEEPSAKKPAKAPRKSGPFVTTDDIRFAIKVMLACMICYLIYNGVAWQGISTALLTCYFTAETTIGGTFRKFALRIAGVLIGGLLFGIVGVALITSHMDNIVEFTLYVAVVFFTAGWITKGSPRISYAGSQIAMSYGLATLMTPVITTGIVEPRDRLVGVLLGTIVMWYVFTRLWPVDTLPSQKQAVAGLIRTASDLALLAVDDSPRPARSAKVRKLRESVNKTIKQAEDQADLSEYEPKEGEAVKCALSKCLEITRNLLTLEMAHVELSIQLTHETTPSEASDKQDAQQTSDYLCLLAKQIAEGPKLETEQLREKEHQFEAVTADRLHNSDDPEQDESPTQQAFVNASTHIRERRSGLLEKLSQTVEDVTLYSLRPQPES